VTSNYLALLLLWATVLGGSGAGLRVWEWRIKDIGSFFLSSILAGPLHDTTKPPVCFISFYFLHLICFASRAISSGGRPVGVMQLPLPLSIYISIL